MNKRQIIFGLLVIALLVCLLVFLRRKPVHEAVEKNQPETAARGPQAAEQAQPTPTTPSGEKLIPPVNPAGRSLTREEEYERHVEAIKALMGIPIVFYGEVVDEQGTPITDAKVSYSANNNPDPLATGSKGETTTDAKGLFSFRTSGIGVYVEVSKEGYYRTPEINGRRGSYGGFQNQNTRKLGNTDVPIAGSGAPAIFVLKQKGDPVALIHQHLRSVRVAKDGIPVEIDLAKVAAVPVGKGSLKVEVWIEDEAKDAQGHYSWKSRISIPGGGLFERKNPYEFVAPDDGYAPSAEISMTTSADRWQQGVEKEYFAKLGDGHFARFSFALTTAGDHFVTLESYLNPTPGSRNLEFDPAKEIKP